MNLGRGDQSDSLGAVSAVPLLAGDAGVAQTIALMRRLIDSGVKNPRINALAVSILQQSGAPQHDPLAEARAIYSWMLANIRFVNDPVGVDQDGTINAKETLRTPETTLNIAAGDCDDFTVLMSTLLQSIGLSTRIITVASDPSDPSQFTHVYPEVLIDGEWIPVDAARPGAQFGLAPDRVYRRKVWGEPARSSGLMGMQRRSSLAGYAQLRSLGDQSQLAQDITAASQGAADVIIAANAAPENIYGTVSTTGQPNALYTAGSPAIAPYAGYSTQVYSPFGTLTGWGLLAAGGA